jgi:ABC-2 type transport system ATP-binding protein
MAILQAISLGKQYNGIAALSDLNLSIERGEVYCLLGQNGAGKTTTINLFLGFIQPSTGKVLIHGEELNNNNDISKKYVAYIPEVVQLYGHLSGLENLDFFSRLAGFRYRQNELSGFLTRTGLHFSAQSKRLSAYSKGMRQKVGIAIALAKNADLILMDEPTSGLDPKATAEFNTICRSLAADGKTVFMATHDIFNAVAIASTIGIMKEGRLVHQLSASGISAAELQQLYLQTI